MRSLTLSTFFAFAILTGCSGAPDDTSRDEGPAEATEQSSSAVSSSLKARCDACLDTCNHVCDGHPGAPPVVCNSVRLNCVDACFQKIECRVSYPGGRGSPRGEGSRE